MTQDIFTVPLQECQLCCKIVGEGHHRVVTCQQEKHKTDQFTDVSSVVEAFPQLTCQDYLLSFAKILIFFDKGPDYTVIENPDDFRVQFKERVQKEKDSFESDAYLLSINANFLIDEIAKPQIVPNNGKDAGSTHLIFYVQKNLFPLKVICPFPLTKSNSAIRYETLPHKSC